MRKPKLTKKLILENNIGEQLQMYNHPILCQAVINESGNWNYNIHRDMMLWHIKERGMPTHVLEVACGDGTFSKAAGEYDENQIVSVGIDYEPQLIDAAKSRVEKLGHSNEHYICADITHDDMNEQVYQYAPDGFDMITITWCTIGYLTHQQVKDHLKVMYSALKPGGVYYLCLGNYVDPDPQGVPTSINAELVKKTPINGKSYVCGEFAQNWDAETQTREVVFFYASEDHQIIHSATQKLHWWPKADLVAAAAAAGFNDIRGASHTGSYLRQKFSRHKFFNMGVQDCDILMLVK